MKRLIWMLLISSCFAQTWATWNGTTVGTSSTNLSSWNGTTIGTSSTNLGAWNGLTSPGGAAASWGTISQNITAVYSTECVFGTTCTTASVTIAAGHVLAVGVARNGNAAEYLSSITAGACNGSWQFPAGSHATGASGIVEWAYCLVSASYTGTITLTWPNWQGRQIVRIFDVNYTGTAAVVDAQATYNSSNSTTPSGVALTLSGKTAYLTCQGIADSVGAVTTPGAPYNTNFHADVTSDSVAFAGFSCALNNSSGTAPTWGTPNSTSTVSGLALGVN